MSDLSPNPTPNTENIGKDPTDLRSTIAQGMKELGLDKQPLISETVSRETSKTETASKDSVPPRAESQGARGADGKFAKVDPPSADAKTDAGAPAATADEIDEAPATWTAEAKALWKDLAPKLGEEQQKILKAEIRKREKDAKDGIIAKDNEIKRYKPVYDEVAPILSQREQSWRANGMSTQQALQQLLNLSDHASRDPAGFLKYFAQRSGIDLTTLHQAAAQAGNAPELPPQVVQYLNGLHGEIQSLKAGFQERDTNSRAAEIQTFINEKDSAGQPLRPHFDAVYPEMRLLMPRLAAEHPDKSARQLTEMAYERAVWSTPEIRTQLIAQQEASKRGDADASARAKAASVAAKLSADSGSPNHLPAGEPDPKDLRATLLHGYNKLIAGESRLQ